MKETPLTASYEANLTHKKTKHKSDRCAIVASSRDCNQMSQASAHLDKSRNRGNRDSKKVPDA